MGITVTPAMASHSLPLLGSWFADDDDLRTPSLFSAVNMTIIGGSVCAARDKLDDVRRCRGRSFVNSDNGGARGGALRRAARSSVPRPFGHDRRHFGVARACRNLDLDRVL